jgi:hypothetical protein
MEGDEAIMKKAVTEPDSQVGSPAQKNLAKSMRSPDQPKRGRPCNLRLNLLSVADMAGVAGTAAAGRKPIRFKRWELRGETILHLISALHQKRPPPCRPCRWP